MTHNEVMPGKQNMRWVLMTIADLSTTLLLYHTAGKIDSKNKVLDEIGGVFG